MEAPSAALAGTNGGAVAAEAGIAEHSRPVDCGASAMTPRALLDLLLLLLAVTLLEGAAREASAVDILRVGCAKAGVALLGGGCPYKKGCFVEELYCWCWWCALLIFRSGSSVLEKRTELKGEVKKRGL